MMNKRVKSIVYDLSIQFKEGTQDCVITSDVTVTQGKAQIARGGQSFDVPLSVERLQAVIDLFQKAIHLIQELPTEIPINK